MLKSKAAVVTGCNKGIGKKILEVFSANGSTMGDEVPTDITLEDKTTSEQLRLIAELDEKDKSIVFGMIETMLTKKKFKDFFNKNVAAL